MLPVRSFIGRYCARIPALRMYCSRNCAISRVAPVGLWMSVSCASRRFRRCVSSFESASSYQDCCCLLSGAADGIFTVSSMGGGELLGVDVVASHAERLQLDDG